MQSIVADTTPLNYLVLIQAADILPSLYRKAFIPPAVRAELAHANTPAIVRAWISQPPQWLEVVSLKRPIDSALAHLGAGEREAIRLHLCPHLGHRQAMAPATAALAGRSRFKLASTALFRTLLFLANDASHQPRNVPVFSS